LSNGLHTNVCGAVLRLELLDSCKPVERLIR
jgi:hypothetical protein